MDCRDSEMRNERNPLWVDSYYGTAGARKPHPLLTYEEEEACLTALLSMASSHGGAFRRDVAVTRWLCRATHMEEKGREIFAILADNPSELDKYLPSGELCRVLCQVPRVNRLDISRYSTARAQQLLNFAKDLDSLPVIVALLDMGMTSRERPNPDDILQQTSYGGKLYLGRILTRMSVTQWLAIVSPRTLLDAAAAGGLVEMVKEILHTHPTAILPTATRPSSLHYAAANGRLAVVRFLVLLEAVDCNAKDANGDTPLHRAAVSGHLDIVRLLMASDKIECNARNAKGWTALHRAAVSGDLETVRLLIASEKVDCNRGNVNGYTALHYAASNGHLEVVRLLIASEKVECYAETAKEWSALHFAASNGHLEVVRLLIETDNVLYDARNAHGSTALHLAAASGHLEVVRLLIATGKVGCKTKNADGYSALHYAAANGYLAIVRFLESTG